MIKVAWNNEGRADKPDKYTSQWDDNKGRLSAFLGGWTDWTENNRYEKDKLHWRTVGAQYASTFGSREAARQVSIVVRCELYHVSLTDYVKSRRCADWTDEQRERAIGLSWEEIERRGGVILT